MVSKQTITFICCLDLLVVSLFLFFLMEKKNLLKQNRRPTKAGQLASILIRHSNVLHNRINEKIITNISLLGGPIFMEKKNLLKQSRRPTKVGRLASILIID